MTVSTDSNRAAYDLNGTTTVFPVPFYFFADTDLVVTHNTFDASGTLASSVLILNTDYTVSGANDEAGGSITTTSALAAGNGDNIIVKRVVDATQLTAYPANSPFPSSSHERALDKLTMLFQQMQEQQSRSLVLTDIGNAPAPLPPAVPSALWQWNSTGTAVQYLPLGGDSVQVDTVLTTPATGQFFAGNGSSIHRLNDRLFVGGATDNDGAFPNVNQDWLTQFIAGYGVPSPVVSGVLAALTGTQTASGQAIIGGAQTLHFTGDNGSAIGTSGYALSNNTTYLDFAFGFYGEAHRMNNTGGAYGMELDVTNYGDFTPIDPYGQVSGTTSGHVIALQLAGGAAHSAVGQQSPSAALVVVANPMAFDKGIIFQSGSVNGAQKEALSLPSGFSIQWYGTTNTRSSRITCNGTSTVGGTLISILEGGTFFQNPSSFSTNFAINTSSSGANYLSVAPSNTGAPLALAANGSDTDVDIKLAPKGAGVVRFGTFTTTAPSATGYITIKDSAGTTRKLLAA